MAKAHTTAMVMHPVVLDELIRDDHLERLARTTRLVSMEPFRAFVADKLPEKQRTSGFAMQSIFIGLGAVIRGGTPHFDYVSEGTSLGLGRVSLDAGIPVVFGVLTTDDDAQALERAGGEHGNKGYDAALTAIEMTLFDRKLVRDGITTKRT